MPARRLAVAAVGFECEPYARYDGGDHEIFVGHVLAFRITPHQQTPLIFFGGRYHCLDAGSRDVLPREVRFFDGWW